MKMPFKRLIKVVESKWQSEGRGARVRRSIGRPELRNLDPFLMLDEFQGNADDGAGFPDHPHRGFETVSYLLEGRFIHEDFTGRKGQMGPGDLQWRLYLMDSKKKNAGFNFPRVEATFWFGGAL